jgi:tRNA-guanine family transglycosylase
LGIGIQLIQTKIIHRSGELSRITEIKLNDKVIQTPIYFPSVSSYGVKVPLSDLLYLLSLFSYRQSLVSAYDLWLAKQKDEDGTSEKLLSSLQNYNTSVRQKKKGLLFLDSGNYESFWYRDKKWNFNCYKQIVTSTDLDFYSSYDIIAKRGSSEKELESVLERTFNIISECEGLRPEGQLVSILHGVSPQHILKVVKRFLETYPHLCKIIGIPERDCGSGIFERAQTIREIRKLIDSYNDKYILHILGCGDPLSTLLFSYCGADSFDSLDWYEHTFDPETLILRDNSHLEMLNCGCKACDYADKKAKVQSALTFDKYIIHNLYKYQNFMTEIQAKISDDLLHSMVISKFGTEIDSILK